MHPALSRCCAGRRWVRRGSDPGPRFEVARAGFWALERGDRTPRRPRRARLAERAMEPSRLRRQAVAAGRRCPGCPARHAAGGAQRRAALRRLRVRSLGVRSESATTPYGADAQPPTGGQARASDGDRTSPRMGEALPSTGGVRTGVGGEARHPERCGRRSPAEGEAHEGPRPAAPRPACREDHAPAGGVPPLAAAQPRPRTGWPGRVASRIPAVLVPSVAVGPWRH